MAAYITLPRDNNLCDKIAYTVLKSVAVKS